MGKKSGLGGFLTGRFVYHEIIDLTFGHNCVAFVDALRGYKIRIL